MKVQFLPAADREFREAATYYNSRILTAPRLLARPDALRPMNTLIAIYPYKHEGLWVFDDAKVGLVQEPFVSGADVIIDRMTSSIPGAEKGFRLLFSATPFPGFMAKFEWRREDLGGNWYYSRDLDSEGWLCPALLKYFETAPRTIYAKFEPQDVCQSVAAVRKDDHKLTD